LKLKEKKHKVSIQVQALMDNARPLNYQDLPMLKLDKEIEMKL
jgi:hypothetical protein